MSDLLARLKAGRTAVKPITINGVEMGLRILTEQDYLEANIATEQAMKSAGLELGMSTAEAFEAEKASQLMARALVDIGTGKQIVLCAKELREAISRNEKVALIDAYLDHEKEFSPSERTMSEAEFSALLEEVKKTPGTPSLNGLSTTLLKRLITCLAFQPAI